MEYVEIMTFYDTKNYENALLTHNHLRSMYVHDTVASSGHRILSSFLYFLKCSSR